MNRKLVSAAKLLALFALPAVMGSAGCDTRQFPDPSKPNTSSPSAKSAPAPAASSKKAPAKEAKKPVARTPGPLAPSQPADGPEAHVVRKLGVAIRESVELGPTVVVWILDRTSSAAGLVGEVTTAAQAFYDSPEARAWLAADAPPLGTAVIAFDSEVEFVIDPPTADAQKAKEALTIRASAAIGEKPFTAVKQAVEKYLPLRTKERRELMFIIVTDETGDDPALVDELVETTRRNAIPVYVIGLPSPWGQVNPFAPDPKALDKMKADELTPALGPESLQSERVDIENWAAQHGARANLELVDSGFGPFALERLARGSRGQFFAIREGSGFGRATFRSWPNGMELRFDDKVVSRYTPDYVSAAEYDKLLAENKARAALCEAAKIPKVAIDGSPGSRFPKAAEAKMAKQMSQAQQFAARNLPPVDRLYDILVKGEPDRAKLTSPRWQAEFDLALGRVLANKARLEGYNSMIAALKRGKTFQNPDSKEWVLEPADMFETESTIRKLAERAKTYLERVVKEHAGTPWARIAEEELKVPLGWSWKEA